MQSVLSLQEEKVGNLKIIPDPMKAWKRSGIIAFSGKVWKRSRISVLVKVGSRETRKCVVIKI